MSVCVQGNQMTLVYMEREYSSPEDPHEGIVHLVEVRKLVTNTTKKNLVFRHEQLNCWYVCVQNNSTNAQLL